MFAELSALTMQACSPEWIRTVPRTRITPGPTKKLLQGYRNPQKRAKEYAGLPKRARTESLVPAYVRVTKTATRHLQADGGAIVGIPCRSRPHSQYVTLGVYILGGKLDVLRLLGVDIAAPTVS